ncbi:MAG: SdpI family protein [Pseudoclavibacter sp.]
MAITAPIGLIFTVIIVYATLRASSRGNLGRNDFIGVRTRWTMASDDAWREGHKAAHPPMLAACIAGACLGVLAIVAFVAGTLAGFDDLTELTTLSFAAIGYAALITLLFVGMSHANKAAKQEIARGKK